MIVDDTMFHEENSWFIGSTIRLSFPYKGGLAILFCNAAFGCSKQFQHDAYPILDCEKIKVAPWRPGSSANEPQIQFAIVLTIQKNLLKTGCQKRLLQGFRAAGEADTRLAGASEPQWIDGKSQQTALPAIRGTVRPGLGLSKSNSSK